MSMEHWENIQRHRGNIAGAEMALTLRKQFGDIPFPSAATLVEKPIVKTPETPVKIKRFSKEAREALEKQGFVIYGLTGQSIKTLRNSHHKFWSTWHQDAQFADFEALGSMHSEVAINPSKLFLSDSNNKILVQQQEMVEKHSSELGSKVKGVKAIIGDVADYIELAFTHLDATNARGKAEYLFGAKDNYDYTRTKTPTSGSRVAAVGDFLAGRGLRVGSWGRGVGDGDVHVAPLVVPI